MVVEAGQVRQSPRGGLRAGLPARLGAVFGRRLWARRPEPRVRYGHLFLPGLAAIGRLRERAGELVARAEAVSGGRFTYWGRTVEFRDRIDWSARGLPRAWAIALNRLDELQAIGVAAALAPSPEGRAAWYAVASDLIEEWIEGTRSHQGPAWSVAALGGRIANLVHAYVFFAAELRTDARLRGLMLESLYRQAETLAAEVAPVGQDAAHPADPWLIGAGRALFMAGRFFDGMEARRWLEAGVAILWTQLREQVHEDGGHRSRSPAWQAFVLAQYLEVCAALRASNDDVPVWGRKRVKGMADFVARVRHPDGTLPRFHGAVPAWVPTVDELLAVAAVLFHEPALATGAALPGLWPLLVLGDGGERAYLHLARPPEPPAPRALRRTGYYVLPGDMGDVMLVDGDAAPADGHASALGYELSVGGLRLVVDAGPTMEEAGPWAEYFRGPQGHSVVTIARDEPAAVRAVSDVVWAVRGGLTYLAATQHGLAAHGPDLRHRRRVLCLPGRFWLVCDTILGSGRWEAESAIHLHPEAVVHALCQGRPVVRAARSPAASVALAFAGPTVRVAAGVEAPRPEGWHAALPGERAPAPVVVLAVAGELPLLLAYAIVPRPAGPVRLTAEHDAFAIRARLTVGEQTYDVAVLEDEFTVTVG